MQQTMMKKLLEIANNDRTGYLRAIQGSCKASYARGKNHGAIELARELLEYLGVDWREVGKEVVASDSE